MPGSAGATHATHLQRARPSASSMGTVTCLAAAGRVAPSAPVPLGPQESIDGVIQLADKYSMAPVLLLCEEFLLGGPPPPSRRQRQPRLLSGFGFGLQPACCRRRRPDVLQPRPAGKRALAAGGGACSAGAGAGAAGGWGGQASWDCGGPDVGMEVGSVGVHGGLFEGGEQCSQADIPALHLSPCLLRAAVWGEVVCTAPLLFLRHCAGIVPAFVGMRACACSCARARARVHAREAGSWHAQPTRCCRPACLPAAMSVCCA